MAKQTINSGVVHNTPKDLKEAVLASSKLVDEWQSLTPLARNEWICWIEDAKKVETRQRRIDRLTQELSNGKRRPCCWAGCRHR